MSFAFVFEAVRVTLDTSVEAGRLLSPLQFQNDCSSFPPRSKYGWGCGKQQLIQNFLSMKQWKARPTNTWSKTGAYFRT